MAYLDDVREDPTAFDAGSYLRGRALEQWPDMDPAVMLADPRARRLLTRLDPLAFALVYFSHHVQLRLDGEEEEEDGEDGPVTLTRMHVEACQIAREWVRPRAHRDAIIGPRNVGKSTWVFLLLPMWALAHRHRTFAIAFADNANMAMQHLITFKAELDSNELLRKDYPGLCEPRRRSTGASVADRRDLYVSRNDQIFRAAGVDSTNLGAKIGRARPDLIIFDDVEPGESNYCVGMDELVLTADLRWVRAGDLRVGDELYALDEEAPGGASRNGRGYRRATVTEHAVRLLETVKVTFANGDTVFCTPEHPFLAAPIGADGRKAGMATWVKAADLGSNLGAAKVFTPWEQDMTRDAGWLAGIYDGEGSFTSCGSRQSAPYRLSVAQKPGRVLDKMKSLLDARGVQYTTRAQASGVENLWFRGGYAALLKLLGELRPERLIDKLGEPRAVQAAEWARVVSVEPVGPTMIAVMGTSTKTFFANGYAVHNSDYQKDQRLASIVNEVFPMNRRAAIIFAGTVFMAGSIMHDLVRVAMSRSKWDNIAGVSVGAETGDEDDWPHWVDEQRITPHYYPAMWFDDDGEPCSIWPQFWPADEWLEGEPTPEYRTAAFQVSMQNNPRGRDDGWWKEEDFHHETLGNAATRCFMQIDPAVTDHKRSDYTGIVVIKWQPAKGGVPPRVEIVYADRVKLIGERLRQRILNIQRWYPEISAIFVESNLGGELWRQSLHGMPVQVLTKYSDLPKEVRIARALDWYQRPGKRVVHSNQACAKLELDMIAYPNLKHDDLVDCAALGILRCLGYDQQKRKRVGIHQASYVRF